MRFQFDGFNRYNIPTLTLANPNFEELHIIRDPKDLQASIRFNAISELSFYVDKTEKTKHYFDYLVKKRLIHVAGFGWFVILNAEMTTTGRTPRKVVNCVSYEVMLTSKPVDMSAGTYVFYNPASPEGTLLAELFGNTFTWSIGYVSPSLYGKARTFDMPDTDVYSFLTQDVAEAYECVFVFDIEGRVVSAYTVDELVKDSDVMMRFDTIMKSISIKETKDEIVTALSVYGASEFSINHVNPLGTPTIYKFDYYKDMMTPTLWQAIQAWQAEVDIQTVLYAGTLTDLKERNVELLKLRSDLAKMQAILDSGKQVRDVQTPYTLQASSNTAVSNISAWIDTVNIDTLSTLVLAATAYPAISFLSPPSDISGYVSNVTTVDRGIAEALVNIWACERVIAAQEANMEFKESQITDLRDIMSSINSSLSIPNNFSLEQREELEKYIFGTDYTNEYCVITESMTYPEIQDIAMELLSQGKSVLDRIAQPTYEFELEAINYLFDKRFEAFINQTKLGYIVHAEIGDDEWVAPILLEVNLNWANPDNFSMKFGNRFRLQSSEYIWADLDDEMGKISSAVSSEFSKLVEPSRSGVMDEVTALLTNVWDAAKNAVIAGDNQSMVMDRHGLLGRRITLDADGNPTRFYDPQQFRMIHDMLCFTDDNWQNVKVALGRIQLEDGTYAYGLGADVIIGKLVAGNNFVFTNESGGFRFDGEGATLTNASLSIMTEDGLSRILMDSTNGFRIQSRDSTTGEWVDEAYMSSTEGLVISSVIDLRATTDGLSVRVDDAESGLSTLSEQTTEGFTQMVRKDGVVSAINQTEEVVKIQASKIQLEGIVTANDNFKILMDGSIEARNGKFFGAITASSGVIGGFTIGANGLSGNGLVLLNSGRINFGNYGYIYGTYDNFVFGSTTGQFDFSGVVRVQHLQATGNALASGFYGSTLQITGSKNSLVETPTYGKRLLNAYETAEYFFADLGEATVTDGECVVNFDPIFSETVNTHLPYHVKLTPYGNGHVWVAERTPTHFVVRGDNIGFGWEVAAKRLGYEDCRLEQPTFDPENFTPSSSAIECED